MALDGAKDTPWQHHQLPDTARHSINTWQTNDINKSMLESRKYKIQVVLACQKRSLVSRKWVQLRLG